MSSVDDVLPDGAPASTFSLALPEDSLFSPKTTNPPTTSYPPLLMVENADTLVYIDPAPQAPSSTTVHFSTRSAPHLIRSETLLDTGSSYFRKLFEPRAQARTIKRRCLEGKLPSNVRYVIDLTPPSVEDEAVIFLTELSCPLGIRTWQLARRCWNLPASCVGGQDEQDPKTQKGGASAMDLDTTLSITDPIAPVSVNAALPGEYSATRHRIGIEYILYALQGHHPPVDTPCKFWTFFSLARLFEISTVPRICDFILAWIYYTTNTRLIESHPEVAYRVACGTKCGQLCRDSFSILVGEEALLLLAYSDDPTMVKRPHMTVHGRMRELLDDEEIQRVEYASKSFVEYVVNQFIKLVDREMTWLSGLSSFQRILNYTPKSRREGAIVSGLIFTLKVFVRGRIVRALTGSGMTLAAGNLFMRGETYPGSTYEKAYDLMRPEERVMSKTFWTRLTWEDFSGVFFQPIDAGTVADLGHLPAFKHQQTAHFRAVDEATLKSKVWQYNELFDVFRRHLDSAVADYPGSHATPFNIHQQNLSIARQKQDLWNQEATPWSLEVDNYEDGAPLVLRDFLVDVRDYVSSYAENMLGTGRDDAMTYEFTDTLTCLTDNELKYLPLWAGGNDDGSGGVFVDQDIPAMETGFSRPGPSIHTGSTVSSGSTSTLGSNDFESTVQGASHNTTDGYLSAGVMSMDSTIASEYDEIQSDFDMVMAEGETSSLLLEPSSADEDCEFFDDSSSDSSVTIVMGPPSHSDGLSDFEELTVVDNHQTEGEGRDV